MNFIRYCDYSVDDPSLIISSEDAPLSALLWVETSELINLDHVAYISLGEGKNGDWGIYFKLTDNNHVTWPYKIKEEALAAYIKLVKTITG
jgi:hypothetical protein